MAQRGVWKGFWRSTGRKVAMHQKNRIQRWFTHHPTTFLLAWGMKGLVVNVPAAGYRGWRALRGNPVIKQTSAAPEPAVTVISTPGSGPAARRWARAVGAATAANGSTRMAPVYVINLNERNSYMDNSRTHLKRSHLGGLFNRLTDAIESFIPPSNIEVSATRDFTNELWVAFQQLGVGLDAFADTMIDAGLTSRVVNRVYEGAEYTENITARILMARNRIESHYHHRIEQEESRVGVVRALPVLVDDSGAPAGVVPLSTNIRAIYAAFTPRLDEEATSILEVLRISQLGMGQLSKVLDDLTENLQKWKFDRKVTTKMEAAASEAYDAAEKFADARSQLNSLYRAQLASEAEGTASIINIPIAS